MNDDAELDSEFRSRQSNGQNMTETGRHKNCKIKITNAVNIRTIEEGVNSGRAYCIRSETGEECRRIAADLRLFSKAARRRFELRTPLQRFQERLKANYDSWPCQGFVGLLIIAVMIPTPSMTRMLNLSWKNRPDLIRLD